MNFTLRPDRSKTLRALSEAVDNFFGTDIFNSSELKDAFDLVRAQGTELIKLFPELEEPARKYDADYDYDVPEWINESEDHTEAAFNVIVMLVIIEKMTTEFQNVDSRLSRLSQDISDLASFSVDFNMERGLWK